MEDNKIIYFDNAASSKVDDRVLKIYQEASVKYFANPSSIHFLGSNENNLLSKVHNHIKELLNIPHHDVIFTSGATESNNLAIKGYCFRYSNRGKHIVTSLIEHPSVLEVYKQLEKNFGYSVTYLPVNKDGVVTLQSVKESIRNDTILVSIMHVNNETGAVNPINDIADYLSSYPKIAFHVDGVQAFGKLNQKFDYSKIDMYTITGHKNHGLIGCGILLKKENIELSPLLCGGGQEKGFRSGTSDLPHALAMEKTIELALKEEYESFLKVKELSNSIVNYLSSHNDLFSLNSSFYEQNPYIINFSLINKKASVVVEALSNKGIMVSSISACHSSKEKYSYVIKAMGKDDALSFNTIRISLDKENTIEEVNTFISSLEEIIKHIR